MTHSPPSKPAAKPATKSFDRSIVEGPVVAAVWAVAWPTVLANVIGGMQGLIDHALVGHLVGYAGNAAVGVSWQIFLVVITFMMSIFTGMGVLVSRYTGMGDAEAVNHASYQGFIAALVLALVVLAPAGWFLSPALLGIVHAAPEVKAQALPFLRTLFLGSVGMMLGFMIGGALRAAGDARTGMRLGISMTVLNVTFNLILIRGLGPIPALGTMGAALGMVSAATLTSAYGLYRLLKGGWVIHWHSGMDRSFDWPMIKELLRFGMPAGIQGVAMNVAGVMLLRFMGSLPESGHVQAVYAVGYNQLFSFITWTSVGLMGAAAAVAGQNLGAGKPERSVQAVHAANRLGLMIAVFMGVLFLAVPRFLFGLFGMQDAESLARGVELMRWLAVSGLLVTTALTYSGGLTGTGDTKGPMFISIISQIVIPIGLLETLSASTALAPHHIWLAIVLGHFARATLSIWRFRLGKWRSIKIAARVTA
ncbi:MAG: MATE family efflux transporter [Gemmatimonadetes bacterium]|nr:MATE family efflux transporter [Gemmatimonadota bacterium]